jgi:fused signal recognition particle receptor
MDTVAAVEIAAAAAAAGGAAWWALRATRGRRPAAPETSPAAPIEAPARGIRQALAASGRRFREQLGAALGGGTGSADVLDGVEEALVAADMGSRTSASLVASIRRRLPAGGDGTAIIGCLREEIGERLAGGGPVEPTAAPWIVLVVGVNGVGKTTTIGKLAEWHRAAGRKVLVVAADTFRAAAIEQLETWAGRAGADIVRHGPGADPSAVVYDGIRAAVARGADVVLVDTAGRLHTRTNLMDELRKVRRTIEREAPSGPHETLLVLDATTGQNALNQARSFAEAAGVTGVVVTKLDGTAKGGVVVAVREELGLPVRFVGVGEGIADLRGFDADEFVTGLLEDVGRE